MWAGPEYSEWCLLVMLLLMGGASVFCKAPIGHVVIYGQGQIILNGAYWSCCYKWVGPVYSVRHLLVMLLFVGRARVF